jgi:hypothetical protein
MKRKKSNEFKQLCGKICIVGSTMEEIVAKELPMVNNTVHCTQSIGN